MAKCLVEDCCNPTWASGERTTKASKPHNYIYCRKHSLRIEKHGTLEIPKPKRVRASTLEARFWSYVDKRGDDECWEWQADCSRAGYGGLWNSETNNNISVHRYSYELHHGNINAGMLVLHSCDNKKCVNPKHLRQGTVKENVQDAIERGLRPRCAIPIKTGEENPKSKITLEQARFIKQNPEIPHTVLAKSLGVSPNCVRGVRIGRTWKDA